MTYTVLIGQIMGSGVAMPLHQGVSLDDRISVIHISDLHFGDGQSPPNQKSPSGLYPHDPTLCEALVEALEDLRVADGFVEDSTLVVMSGDGSATGAGAEFRNMSNFLSRACGGIKMLLIPGNHDHWSGVVPSFPARLAPTFNPAIKPVPFPPTPTKPAVAVSSPNGAVQLLVVGIDSNSGFDGAGPKKLLGSPGAGGLISADELKELRQQIRAAPADTAVLVLCHHSLETGDGLFAALPLDAAQRDELVGLARHAPLLALLTGHQHTFWFRDWHVKNVDGSHSTLAELRSPTTTQGKRSSRRPQEAKRQGFWVHTLTKGRGTVRMSSRPYVWNGNRFAESSPGGVVPHSRGPFEVRV